MNAFRVGLSDAIFERQSSVSFSDLISPFATFGATLLIVITVRALSEARVEAGRVEWVLVRVVVPVGGAEACGRLRQALEHRDQLGQAALFSIRLGFGEPFSDRHVPFIMPPAAS